MLVISGYNINCTIFRILENMLLFFNKTLFYIYCIDKSIKKEICSIQLKKSQE